MSIWTSKPVALAVALLLAGCGGGGIGGGGSFSAPARTVVTADQIVVAGPEGYCVDPTSTRDAGDTAFVLLGNCAAIRNSRRAAQPNVPSVLTAAISGPGQPGRISSNLDSMDAFFRSENGLELLSRSEDPTTVTVLDTAIEGDVFYLNARDTSDGPIDGVQEEYWRAYLDIGSRIATLSVLGVEGQSSGAAQNQDVLRTFVRVVQASNSGAPIVDARPVADPQPQFQSPPPASVETRPLWNIGLFRRIFG